MYCNYEGFLASSSIGSQAGLCLRLSDKGAAQRSLKNAPGLYGTQIRCLIRQHCGTGHIRDCRDKSTAMPLARRYTPCRHQAPGQGNEAYCRLSKPATRDPLARVAVSLSSA